MAGGEAGYIQPPRPPGNFLKKSGVRTLLHENFCASLSEPKNHYQNVALLHVAMMNTTVGVDSILQVSYSFFDLFLRGYYAEG